MSRRSDEFNALAKLNRRMVADAISGLPDEAGNWLPPGGRNHINFLCLHLTDSRALAANLMEGPQVEHAFSAMLATARGIDDIRDFPPLEEVAAAWHATSEEFERRLGSQDDDALSRDLGRVYPNGRSDLAGVLGFLLTHEAYHIGQINLLRRLAGVEPVRF